MQTDFTHYIESLANRKPLIVAAQLLPTAPIVTNGTELMALLFDAFEHGVVHHSRVTAQLAEMAIRDAEQEAERERANANAAAAGPASLKPHFDAIFGPKKAAG
jgi:hypothetical protein